METAPGISGVTESVIHKKKVSSCQKLVDGLNSLFESVFKLKLCDCSKSDSC